MHGPLGTVHSPSTKWPELPRPGKEKTHNQSGPVPLRHTRESEQLRPGKCMKPTAYLGPCACRGPGSLSNVEPVSTRCGLWKIQCNPSTVRTPSTPNKQHLFLHYPSLPTTQLNKRAYIGGHL